MFAQKSALWNRAARSGGWRLAVLFEEQVEGLGNESLDPGVLLGREDAELASRFRRDLGIERDALALPRLGAGSGPGCLAMALSSLVPQPPCRLTMPNGWCGTP